MVYWREFFCKKTPENPSENQDLNTRPPSNRRRGWKGIFPRKTTPIDSSCIFPNGIGFIVVNIFVYYVLYAKGSPKSRRYGSAFLRHRLPSLFKKKPPVDGENEVCY